MFKSNFITITFPGGISVDVNSAVVQPQVVYARLIVSGAFPRFAIINSNSVISEGRIIPKLWKDFETAIRGCGPSAGKKMMFDIVGGSIS